jgi:hypothetical protein
MSVSGSFGLKVKQLPVTQQLTKHSGVMQAQILLRRRVARRVWHCAENN